MWKRIQIGAQWFSFRPMVGNEREYAEANQRDAGLAGPGLARYYRPYVLQQCVDGPVDTSTLSEDEQSQLYALIVAETDDLVRASA